MVSLSGLLKYLFFSITHTPMFIEQFSHTASCPQNFKSPNASFLFFWLTTLNYNIQFTHLKCTSQWFTYIHQVLQPSPQSILEHSTSQKETLYPLQIILPFFPCTPARATTNHLSISTDLPILGILYRWDYTICGLLLLSFTYILSRFIHSIACTSTSFFFIA